MLGAIFGLLLAVWGVSVLRTTMPAEISAIMDLNTFKVDARALAFAFCIAVLSGVLSGIAPAWQHSRSELNEALKEGGGRSTGGHGHRMRRIFVVAEVSLALILLIGASLMVKGFVALATASPELQPERLLTFTMALSGTRYTEPGQVRRFYRQTLERIRLQPAVQSAAIVSGLPYSFYDQPVDLSLEGQPALAPGHLPSAMLECISGDYFRTMHIALRQGREFDDRDTQEAPRVAVISETMARRLWPGRNLLGKRLKFGPLSSNDPWVAIVGIAADTRHEVYDRSFRSVLYLPAEQLTLRNMDFAIRTAGDPMPVFGSVRQAIAEIDKDRPVAQAESMATKIRTQAGALRYVATLMGIFGTIALALAAVGVYGVMAYSVTERRHEIGIRMALGAGRADVLFNILGRGLTLAATGLAVGVPAALAMAQLLSSFFYGVNTWDTMIFVATPCALAVIALVASYIPARRATKVDPIVVLRYE
jgi:putative ABC transport system permease protein